MEKKRSGTGKGNNGNNHNRNNNHGTSTTKLTETTSSLKNLQLGGGGTATAVSGSKNNSINNNKSSGNNNSSSSNTSNDKTKNTKKSKKSTSNDSSAKSTSASAATTTSSKKSTGPILLGLPDSPMERQDDVDPYITKIGGVPTWLNEKMPASSKYGVCGACGKNMHLLIQAYVPLDKSPYDRVVYVWACNQRLCMRKNGSFRVVRALKLNPEYAQKLEKKPKPAVVAPTPAPLVNPFAAPGSLSNTLFGGNGSGFVNPFASPSGSANPFAAPPGFGTGFQAPPLPTTTTAAAAAAPVAKSFASVTSSNIPQDPNSESEDEEEETSEQTEWPEELPSFDPHYLYISEEVLEKSDKLNDDISKRYAHLLALEEAANEENDDEEGSGGGSNGATWSGETYEKSTLPKGVDKAFKKFTERVQSWPDQCVRYDFPGIPLLFSYSDNTAQTLLPPNSTQHSKHSTPSAHRIPKCPSCKGPRGFEFQLMPHMLSLLDVTSTKYLSEEENKSLKDRKGVQLFDIGMEWGTILVYSCVEDCFGKKAQMEEANNNDQHKVKYFEEVALVQFED
ncbi:hypothetical protein BGZ76_001774 [Entomortierella beljakovae]|nr:hypothetical protein BGZ76_001774 [Entomortierella beljakovae]